MKMPWYSLYNADSSQRSRHRPQSRASNPTSNTTYHTIHLASSTYTTPSYRPQTHHYTSYSQPLSGRRHYQQDPFSHYRPEHSSSAYTSSGSRQRHASPSSSSGSSSFKSRSDGSNWYHHRRTVDSATERLLARADALTERLHRLLAKSADLHWRRMDHPVRPDIFNRMTQSKPQSMAGGTPPTPTRASNMAFPSATDTASSVKVDDITVSKTEPKPTTRTHVITIKLSNSYSNRGNHRSHHHQSPEPQKPQETQNSQEPPNCCENQQNQQQQQQQQEYQRQTTNPHSSRPYRQSTTRKPPVVRIIPIQIEVESDDSGVVIDPERDIQVPDDDPRVPIITSPTPSLRNMSPVCVDVDSSSVVDVSVTSPKPNIESKSDTDPDSDLETQTTIRTASGVASGRRLALTLSLAEEKKAEGNAYYKVQDYRKALACYTRAIELCPESVAYYGNRAACRMMMGLYQDALEDARESIRLDTSFAKGYVRIAKCCLALGDTAAALNATNKAEELDPRSDLANEKRSLQILQQLSDEMTKANSKNDYRKVIYCCDRSLEHAPAARRLKLTKAECLALLGRYAEAEEMANDILRSDQTNADALLVRGLCFYYQDNIDRAFLHFKQVLLMAPDHVKARNIFRRAKLLKTKKEEGNDAFKAGRYQEAHDLYTDTLSIDENNKLTNAKVYFNRAVVLVKLGKLKDALSDCNRAIELDETYLKAYLRRAKIYMDLEQYEEAVRDYEKINKMEKNREYKRLLQEAKLALKKSQRKDYYKILGVDRNANEEEIKKAYKKRALVHHPDRHSSATEEEKKEQEKKFKELGEAYGILSDPKKKSRYDNGHDIEDVDSGYSGDIDPNQIFQAFFGGPGMFRMGGGMGGMGGMGGAGMGGHCPGGFNFQFG